MTAVYPLLATVAAYLLGSLSFAVIVTRVMGLSDPRTYGSKNPGATNVLRSGSKKAAIVTLLLDAALLKSSPDGRSYKARIDSLRTEKQMNALFELFERLFQW